MNLNYKVYWFEDTDEAYATLSRRVERYIRKQYFIPQIERGRELSDLSGLDLNTYDLIIVDLKLAKETKGNDVITQIREQNCVNDVLFYSSEGVQKLRELMQQNNLEGVFISDRKNEQFIDKVQQLIDKSVRRSIDVVNIRGIIMDQTSEFDSQMCELIDFIIPMMSKEDQVSFRDYLVKKLIENIRKSANHFADKYSLDKEWSISSLIHERDFSSAYKARALSNLLSMSSITKLQNAIQSVQTAPDSVVVRKEDGTLEKVQFYDAYDRNIIKVRNLFAHVKTLNATPPIYLDTNTCCDNEYCASVRSTLLQYQTWFTELYKELSTQQD